MYAGAVGWWLLATLSVGLATEEMSLSVNTKRYSHVVSDRFLSITIDPALLVDGEYSAGMTKVMSLARGLAPAYVRLGSPASNRYQFLKAGTHRQHNASYAITEAQWMILNDFAQKSGLEPIVCVNIASRQGGTGAWDTRNLRDLVAYSDRRKYKLSWQLGYELQRHKHRFSGKELGNDLRTLRSILDAVPRYRQSKVLAPDITSSDNPEDVEFLKEFLDTAGDALSAVTWEAFEDVNATRFDGEINTLTAGENELADKLGAEFTGKPLWIAESYRDPGQASRFEDGLTWAVKLGEAAKMGVQTVMKRPQLKNLLTPTPDYWVSFLHKTLVGELVLANDWSPSGEVHMFSHCTNARRPTNNLFVNDQLRYEQGSMTFFGVNLLPTEMNVSLKLSSPTKRSRDVELHEYVLTRDGTQSQISASQVPRVLLNGRHLSLDLTSRLPILTPRVHHYTNKMVLSLPANSVGFWVVSGAKVRACLMQDDSSSGSWEQPSSRVKRSTASGEMSHNQSKAAHDKPASSQIVMEIGNWKEATSKHEANEDIIGSEGNLDDNDRPRNDADPAHRWLGATAQEVQIITPEVTDQYLGKNNGSHSDHLENSPQKPKYRISKVLVVFENERKESNEEDKRAFLVDEGSVMSPEKGVNRVSRALEKDSLTAPDMALSLLDMVSLTSLKRLRERRWEQLQRKKLLASQEHKRALGLHASMLFPKKLIPAVPRLSYLRPTEEPKQDYDYVTEEEGDDYVHQFNRQPWGAAPRHLQENADGVDACDTEVGCEQSPEETYAYGARFEGDNQRIPHHEIKLGGSASFQCPREGEGPSEGGRSRQPITARSEHGQRSTDYARDDAAVLRTSEGAPNNGGYQPEHGLHYAPGASVLRTSHAHSAYRQEQHRDRRHLAELVDTSQTDNQAKDVAAVMEDLERVRKDVSTVNDNEDIERDMKNVEAAMLEDLERVRKDVSTVNDNVDIESDKDVAAAMLEVLERVRKDVSLVNDNKDDERDMKDVAAAMLEDLERVRKDVSLVNDNVDIESDKDVEAAILEDLERVRKDVSTVKDNEDIECDKDVAAAMLEGLERVRKDVSLGNDNEDVELDMKDVAAAMLEVNDNEGNNHDTEAAKNNEGNEHDTEAAKNNEGNEQDTEAAKNNEGKEDTEAANNDKEADGATDASGHAGHSGKRHKKKKNTRKHSEKIEPESKERLVRSSDTAPVVNSLQSVDVADSETNVAETKTGVAEIKSAVAESKTGVAESKTGVAETKTGVTGSKTGVTESKSGVTQPKTAVAEPKKTTLPKGVPVITPIPQPALIPLPQFPLPQFPLPHFPLPRFPLPQFPFPQLPLPKYIPKHHDGHTEWKPIPLLPKFIPKSHQYDEHDKHDEHKVKIGSAIVTRSIGDQNKNAASDMSMLLSKHQNLLPKKVEIDKEKLAHLVSELRERAHIKLEELKKKRLLPILPRAKVQSIEDINDAIKAEEYHLKERVEAIKHDAANKIHDVTSQLQANEKRSSIESKVETMKDNAESIIHDVKSQLLANEKRSSIESKVETMRDNAASKIHDVKSQLLANEKRNLLESKVEAFRDNAASKIHDVKSQLLANQKRNLLESKVEAMRDNAESMIHDATTLFQAPEKRSSIESNQNQVKEGLQILMDAISQPADREPSIVERSVEVTDSRHFTVGKQAPSESESSEKPRKGRAEDGGEIQAQTYTADEHLHRHKRHANLLKQHSKKRFLRIKENQFSNSPKYDVNSNGREKSVDYARKGNAIHVYDSSASSANTQGFVKCVKQDNLHLKTPAQDWSKMSREGDIKEYYRTTSKQVGSSSDSFVVRPSSDNKMSYSFNDPTHGGHKRIDWGSRGHVYENVDSGILHLMKPIKDNEHKRSKRYVKVFRDEVDSDQFLSKRLSMVDSNSYQDVSEDKPKINASPAEKIPRLMNEQKVHLDKRARGNVNTREFKDWNLALGSRGLHIEAETFRNDIDKSGKYATRPEKVLQQSVQNPSSSGTDQNAQKVGFFGNILNKVCSLFHSIFGQTSK